MYSLNNLSPTNLHPNQTNPNLTSQQLSIHQHQSQILPTTTQNQTHIMPIRLTEPHPTASTKMTFGRGGAGNATRPPPPNNLTSTRLTTPQSSHAPSYTDPHHKFTTGRGGAGNLHPGTDERPMFRFDEELERERLKEVAPVYHVGRGGSGNAVKEARRGSDGSSGSGSSGSGRGSVEWIRGLAKKF